jgi:hypothetical protein
LIKEGFTDTAIPAVLKSYKETNRFLADNGVAESYGRGGDETPESSADDDEGYDFNMMKPPTDEFRAPPASLPQAAEGLTVNFDMKSVSLGGRTTSPLKLREFITALTALADLFEKVVPERRERDEPENEEV